jgi:hypothetical protein
MPTLREMLQPRRDIERRAVSRTTINRDVLMFFTGQDRVHACCVRDVTNHGAGLRLNGLNMFLPNSAFRSTISVLCAAVA